MIANFIFWGFSLICAFNRGYGNLEGGLVHVVVPYQLASLTIKEEFYQLPHEQVRLTQI
jgi:hypothetical protein